MCSSTKSHVRGYMVELSSCGQPILTHSWAQSMYDDVCDYLQNIMFACGHTVLGNRQQTAEQASSLCVTGSVCHTVLELRVRKALRDLR